MNITPYLIIGLAIANVINGYVLLQMSKGDNQSKVDALIHKVLPSSKFEELADTARKHFKDFKRYQVNGRGNDKELENIVFAINTNDLKEDKNDIQNGREKKFKIRKNLNQRAQNRNGEKLWNYLKQLAVDFMKHDASQPSFRATMEKYNIKPEVLHLRNGEPLMYTIETASLLKGITNALDSKETRRYADKIVKNAAYLYQSINEA